MIGERWEMWKMGERVKGASLRSICVYLKDEERGDLEN